ncbi:MAG: 4-hydroxy-3-methylbut-2-enyl diphosphate reductase [Rhodospirillaceae bacterium]|jgi:4-hydroxy-3-methylbut-2-enyl diphosphate reductase|nr:4-hydroxy-3-methylbut-2-enyl diphosphate reductase [Rhodospirillaceae bacterium]MBT3887456.1 4-hydroxy-3-methylbut-2-enyl diphosphate reductase [Rhodospirillaceae bacterium]MBT4116299.1 4-hydroxy-3-methylbut-2-enyl diphosphate reductase [Rhodospirillaceae bacterium]MBT4671361.1 4-hydroxy-3-methylbut-2-enyl diphosphate reductase [Rhodospirillaceae bacterium]MBT4719426.1 4-hydroxy-3-methylbut-2-enyl diphosphate reductase [Rhodospirillaceae bacterium]
MLPLDVLLVRPRGFCAGVERAIEIVERALQIYGPPVYVRHEIVHNKRVVETLRGKGAIFVEEVSDIPDGSVTIFSAHGISERVENEARLRELPVIDATCPLVSKVHREGRAHTVNGNDVILIGHAGHPEVEGTMGRIPGGVHLVTSLEDVDNLTVSDPQKVAYVTQTTLSVDDTKEIIQALKTRFPGIVGPDVRDICYATQNRQQAVRAISLQVELLLVVGAQNSSNSNRLREIGEELKVRSYLIDDAKGLDAGWLDGVKTVGITAGASAPEELVEELIEKLKSLRQVRLETIDGVEENIQFKLPAELTELDANNASMQSRAG